LTSAFLFCIFSFSLGCAVGRVHFTKKGTTMIALAIPELFAYGGLVTWLLVILAAVGLGIFIERLVFFHRENINSVDFLNGVRTVLKRGNWVEALSICEATPGPVARLVRTAVLMRGRKREEIREALHVAGLAELPRLEEKLGILATLAQIGPVIGFWGTILGFMQLLEVLQKSGVAAPAVVLVAGVWKALVCSGAGLALAVPCYAGYNYLVSRVRLIALDMEKAAAEIQNILCECPD
jgi:biopolymer transport protein ExbB